MTINEIINQAHATANEKGWWNKPLHRCGCGVRRKGIYD